MEAIIRELNLKGKVRFNVKAVPGSSRDEIIGPYGENTIKIRVTGPPEKGKANDAIIKLLAREINVPEYKIRLIKGRSSPHKTIEIIL
jgi:uncharacterized protein